MSFCFVFFPHLGLASYSSMQEKTTKGSKGELRVIFLDATREVWLSCGRPKPKRNEEETTGDRESAS